jgi:hypothetical protein
LSRADGVYHVRQGGDLVAMYVPHYFRTTGEVVADLTERIRNGWRGPYTSDYVVWCSIHVMVVIHEPMDADDEGLKIVLFRDPGNDPNDGDPVPPWSHWPTRDEWVASGRGDLWMTEEHD